MAARMVVGRLGSMVGAGIGGAAIGAGASSAEIMAAVTLLIGLAVDFVWRKLTGGSA